MRKENLSFKKIGKQILSINSYIESFFNKLSSFILNIKKFAYSNNNRVFFAIITIVILTIAYFLIPTTYNKSLIQEEIENQILKKYQINVKFNNKINYGLFPSPYFVSKNLTIFNNEKKNR